MSEWTTYHSVVDTADDWVNTANAVDGSTGTVSTREAIGMSTLILDTPSAASSKGTITKVEHRAYCSFSDNGVPAKLYLSPRFSGGNGDQENITQIGLDWTTWFDITADTNAPGSWVWSDIETLGANVIYSWGSGPVPLAQVGKVEIKVTYTSTAIIGSKSIIKDYYY